METKWFLVTGSFFESKAKAKNLSDGWEKTFEKWDLCRLGLRPNDSARTCGLCDLYLNESPSCQGCPVKASTGKIGCYGTPYEQVIQDESPKDVAEKEIAFLKMVRENTVRENFAKQRASKFDPNAFFLLFEDDQLFLKYKEKNDKTWYILAIKKEGLSLFTGICDDNAPFALDSAGSIILIK